MFSRLPRARESGVRAQPANALLLQSLLATLATATADMAAAARLSHSPASFRLRRNSHLPYSHACLL